MISQLFVCLFVGLGLIDEGAQKKNKKKRKKKKKMIIKSKKTKWVTLSLLTLSVVSLLAHLSVTKFSTVNLVQYSAMDALRADFANVLGTPTQVCVFSFSFIHCFLPTLSLLLIQIYTKFYRLLEIKRRYGGLSSPYSLCNLMQTPEAAAILVIYLLYSIKKQLSSSFFWLSTIGNNYLLFNYTIENLVNIIKLDTLKAMIYFFTCIQNLSFNFTSLN